MREIKRWMVGRTGIAGTGTSLDPGAFGFPAVNSGFGTSYDWAAMDVMGMFRKSTPITI